MLHNWSPCFSPHVRFRLWSRPIRIITVRLPEDNLQCVTCSVCTQVNFAISSSQLLPAKVARREELNLRFPPSRQYLGRFIPLSPQSLYGLLFCFLPLFSLFLLYLFSFWGILAPKPNLLSRGPSTGIMTPSSSAIDWEILKPKILRLLSAGRTRKDVIEEISRDGSSITSVSHTYSICFTQY